MARIKEWLPHLHESVRELKDMIDKIGMLDQDDDKYIRDGALWDACKLCFRRLEYVAPLAQEHAVVRATEAAVKKEQTQLIL